MLKELFKKGYVITIDSFKWIFVETEEEADFWQKELDKKHIILEELNKKEKFANFYEADYEEEEEEEE